ncbi:hypothetical protein [Candidatus Methanomassiliicoccus intestinalis]|uniref:hypothetical protein n=1 Tax=Candidatus Methanomassiliicoccus intestinalis TaxID=1406512 RepID=UPI0037DDDD29
MSCWTCPVCLRARDFQDRAHLRTHLENVHRVYGSMLTRILDDVAPRGELTTQDDFDDELTYLKCLDDDLTDEEFILLHNRLQRTAVAKGGRR